MTSNHLYKHVTLKMSVALRKKICKQSVSNLLAVLLVIAQLSIPTDCLCVIPGDIFDKKIALWLVMLNQ